MKGIAKVALTCLLLAILAVGLLYAYGGNSLKSISYETKPSADAIRVDWSPNWGVRHYNIYRKDVTGSIYTADHIAFEEYDKVGSVSGIHTSFEDKKVESGRYYSYVVRGFSKDKVICDSYNGDAFQYECAGLAAPELGNDGYGENNENSPECIYLYVQIDGGMPAEGVQLYRRADSKGEFEKVDAEAAGGGDGAGTYTFEIEDTSVEPGKTYEYKVRSFAGAGEHQVVSEYSDSVTLSAVNFTGQYEISKMEMKPETSKLLLTIKSDPYNGTLKLDKGAPASLTVTDAKGKTGTYTLALDRDTLVEAGETAELVLTCTSGRLPEIGKLSGTLVVGVESEGVTYEMGVYGWTELTFDLDKRAGTVFVDWDN